MEILIKTKQEIEKMRVASRLAAEVLEIIEPFVVPGVTTEELNRICHQHITKNQKAIPASLNYQGFPKSICTSINNVICHGIPSERVKLKKGDIVNIDVTVKKDGYHGDTSKMFLVGNKVPIFAKKLVAAAQECLYKAIEVVRDGAFFGDIGHAIQSHAEKNHYSVVREFGGHGIGSSFHEAPHIDHYGSKGTGEMLKENMTITIEPMINLGTYEVIVRKDNWTAITKDRRLSAQWEHTLAVTKQGCEILTWREEEQGRFPSPIVNYE